MLDETSSLWVLHGSNEPLRQLQWLQAGPVQVARDGIDLRYLRVGGLELVRRVYVAVRDRDWNTIPAVISDLEAEQHSDSFVVRFRARHTSEDIDFSWDGSIRGERDGRIHYGMEGRGGRDMLYNRIGFCVLHPWRECAGRPFRGETPEGPIDGVLPLLVAPQRFENGVYVPLFPSVSSLAIDLDAEHSVAFEFQGDLFETEDQRNWSDASFKTYCTPLARGFPHQLAEAQPLSQSVIVHVTARPQGTPSPFRSVLAVGAPTGARVPPLGMALTGEALTEDEVSLLSALAPAHLRAEVHLDDPTWAHSLAASLTACTQIRASLELVVFVGRERPGELARLTGLLADATVARVLVLPENAQTVTPDETTPPELVELVRQRLSLDGVPIAGGTDMYFCELNRTRPQVAAMDGVFWSINPQVHAFDDLSVVETVEAQGEQVRTAAAFSGGKKLFVGPVTLRRRRNVNATGPRETRVASLPDSVDPRQSSLFAAAWTLASAKYLSEQGVDAATFYETTGWRGVVQGDDPPPEPTLFQARAGQVFPLYHVIADLCSLRDGSLLEVENLRPLELAALAVAQGTGTTLLVANLTADRQSVVVADLSTTGTVRRLNAETAARASFEAAAFRRSGMPVPPGSELTLEPYESLRIDV